MYFRTKTHKKNQISLISIFVLFSQLNFYLQLSITDIIIMRRYYLSIYAIILTSSYDVFYIFHPFFNSQNYRIVTCIKLHKKPINACLVFVNSQDTKPQEMWQGVYYSLSLSQGTEFCFLSRTTNLCLWHEIYKTPEP